MKIHAILPVFVLLLAAGCSDSEPEFYWYHPGKTLKEAKGDYSECEVQAKDEAAKAVEEKHFEGLRSPAVIASGKKPSSRKEAENLAAKARAEWGAMYEANAFSGCMQSRGYVKLKEKQLSDAVKTKKMPLGALAGDRE